MLKNYERRVFFSLPSEQWLKRTRERQQALVKTTEN
jgi:hypothetical protein